MAHDRGRPRIMTPLDNLHAARAHYENHVTYREMEEIFTINRSGLQRNVAAIAKEYPEFIEFLKELGLGKNQYLARVAAKAELKGEDPEAALEQAVAPQPKRYLGKQSGADLADVIENVIGTLLDMPEGELRAMRTEHKLRHIPELVKSMRLLREQSTENVQKLSLIKAVGIATARQKPENSK